MISNTKPLLESLPKLATVALVMLIAAQTADLTISLFFADTSTSPTIMIDDTTANPATNNDVSKAQEYAKQIVDTHLFGIASEQIVEKAKVIDAPETTLDLKLRGILATGGEGGLAIIAKGKRNEKMYRVDESLPGSAKLKAVYADRVLIESSRGLETLRIELDKNKLSDFQPNNASRDNQALADPKHMGNNLSNLRKQILHNQVSLGKMVNMKPAINPDNGNLLGYRLKDNNNHGELFNQLGLENGDIAIEINGIDLSDRKNARRAMAALRRSRNLQLTVMRDGEQHIIEHQLEP